MRVEHVQVPGLYLCPPPTLTLAAHAPSYSHFGLRLSGLVSSPFSAHKLSSLELSQTLGMFLLALAALGGRSGR